MSEPRISRAFQVRGDAPAVDGYFIPEMTLKVVRAVMRESLDGIDEFWDENHNTSRKILNALALLTPETTEEPLTPKSPEEAFRELTEGVEDDRKELKRRMDAEGKEWPDA